MSGDTERRAGERYRSVWRVAMVTRKADMGLWRVRNMSDRGMMLAADVALELGELLHIALSETVEMNGQIVWAQSGLCGVAFDQPIDVGAVLKLLATEQSEQGYRQPRLPFERQADIVMAGVQSEVQLINVSQSGVGCIHAGQLELGKPLVLRIAGEVRRTAMVRWVRGNQAGLWLTEPLERADLESLQALAARG